MSRTQRCGSCQGCTAKPCRMCTYCLDNPQNGGPGVKKQSCVARRCVRVVESRLQREASNHKLRVGCGHCEECLQPDCDVCLICMDKRVFRGQYLRDAACAKKRCIQGRSLNGSPLATPSPRPNESPTVASAGRAETSVSLDRQTWTKQDEMQNGQKHVNFSHIQLRKRLLAQRYDEMNKKFKRTAESDNSDDHTQPYGVYKGQLAANGISAENEMSGLTEGPKFNRHSISNFGCDSPNFRDQYPGSINGPSCYSATLLSSVTSNYVTDPFNTLNPLAVSQNGSHSLPPDIGNNFRKDRGAAPPTDQFPVLKDRLLTECAGPLAPHSHNQESKLRYQEYSNSFNQLNTNSQSLFYGCPPSSIEPYNLHSYRAAQRQSPGAATTPPVHYGCIVTQPMGPMDQPVVVLQQL